MAPPPPPIDEGLTDPRLAAIGLSARQQQIQRVEVVADEHIVGAHIRDEAAITRRRRQQRPPDANVPLDPSKPETRPSLIRPLGQRLIAGEARI